MQWKDNIQHMGVLNVKLLFVVSSDEQLTFWILQKDSTKNIQNQTIESSKIVAFQLKDKPLINGEKCIIIHF